MKNFNNLLAFLLGFSTAALLWGISLIFLQKTPVFYIPNFKEYSFYPINLTRLFYTSSTSNEQIIKPIQTLKGISLKAIYSDGNNKGFVILEERKKSIFIDLGKSYKGYKLIKISLNYVIFEKNNKKYKISMKKEKIKNNFTIKPSTSSKEIVISKKTFNEYKNNLNKIWRNIGIIKVNEGYKITYIKPYSIFDKIGLKRGDILIEINGRKLKNDADAWDLYKNADKFSEFEIKIKRNNKIKVLHYEMD